MGNPTYELKKYHHRKVWRKGDLEDEQVVVLTMVFYTRKDANHYLTQMLREASGRRWSADISLVKRGDKNSELLIFTGETWVNENTGEDQSEYFWYVVKKIK